MNKLQLYITRSYEGFNHMLEINPEQAVKQEVYDLTEAIDCISYDAENINFFYLLRYTDQGVFVVVMRTIPKNPGDNLAAWIFIPSSLSVPEAELTSIANMIVEIIGNPKISSAQVDQMRSVFDKEYETIPSPAATVKNKGDKYAYRYFGDETGYQLSDFLGNKKYQTSYLPYAGVILAKKAESVTITGHDLTDEPLEQMVKIFPPKLGLSAYHPSIFGEPFDKPYLVPLMGTVEILWAAPGVSDVEQTLLINKPNMRPDAISAPVNPAPRPVNPINQAPVIDISAPETATEPEETKTEQQAPAPEETNAEIRQLDTDEVKQTEPDQVEEAEKTQISTEAPQPVATAPITQASTDNAPEPRVINYDKQRVYNFEIPAKSAAISGMIKFEVHTRNELNESPIDGYELSDAIQEGTSRSNHLIYAPADGLKTKIIYTLIGLVAGIALTLLSKCAFGGGAGDSADATANDSTATVEAAAPTEESPTTTEGKNGNKTQETKTTVTDTSLAAAIKYLDSNKQWDKGTMEAYPDLKGLYDDMNNINRDKIIHTWGTKLKDSRQFATVVNHIKLGKKKTPRLPNGQKTFNKAGDTTIRVQSYLNTVDP